MTELQRLLAACDEQLKQERQCALATVVQVEGSAYRRPGARMLITDAGQLTGTISGGCLEGDARMRALQVMQRGKPEIVVYDSLDLDDDLEHGAQLGCQGLVHVLIEPLSVNENKTLTLLREAVKHSEPVILATILSGPGNSGGAILVTDDSVTGGETIADNVRLVIINDARQLLKDDSPAVNSYGGDNGLSVFFEIIKPAPQLIIYGAGNDVQPLVKLAANLGWRVSVVDGRANLATPARFPQAERVTCIKVDELATYFEASSFVVLMSHNYVYDLAVLRALVNLDHVKYIGMLGPKKKADRMLDELRNEGLKITPEFERKLFGPIGINIGAEAAEEIALAIMAELVAVRNGHPAGFLRDLNGPIHKPEANVQYHAR